MINQENDIVQLVEGFLEIMNHCLDMRGRGGMTEEEKDEADKLRLLGRVDRRR